MRPERRSGGRVCGFSREYISRRQAPTCQDGWNSDELHTHVRGRAETSIWILTTVASLRARIFYLLLEPFRPPVQDGRIGKVPAKSRARVAFLAIRRLGIVICPISRRARGDRLFPIPR